MNALVKRTKFTALGKKRNPSRGPTKNRKGLLPTEKGLPCTKKDSIDIVLNFAYVWHWKDFNTENAKR